MKCNPLLRVDVIVLKARGLGLYIGRSTLQPSFRSRRRVRLALFIRLYLRLERLFFIERVSQRST